MKTAKGLLRQVNWKNAEVSLPILSTQVIASKSAELRCGEHGGTIHHFDSGDETPVIETARHYFLNMIVPMTISQGCCPKGFGRQEA